MTNPWGLFHCGVIMWLCAPDRTPWRTPNRHRGRTRRCPHARRGSRGPCRISAKHLGPEALVESDRRVVLLPALLTSHGPVFAGSEETRPQLTLHEPHATAVAGCGRGDPARRQRSRSLAPHVVVGHATIPAVAKCLWRSPHFEILGDIPRWQYRHSPYLAVVKVAASVIHELRPRCLDDLSLVHRLTDRKPHPVLMIVDEDDALQRSVEVVFKALPE